jgi:hypothetical protein
MKSSQALLAGYEFGVGGGLKLGLIGFVFAAAGKREISVSLLHGRG